MKCWNCGTETFYPFDKAKYDNCTARAREIGRAVFVSDDIAHMKIPASYPYTPNLLGFILVCNPGLKLPPNSIVAMDSFEMTKV